MRYRGHRPDNTQKDIVEALRAIGVGVWHIGRPVDLLTFYRGRWLPLECKSTKHVRKDQAEQTALLVSTGIPRVMTPDEAIRAVCK